MSECPFEVGDMVRDTEEFLARTEASDPDQPDVGVVTQVVGSDDDIWYVYGLWRQRGEWQEGIMSAIADDLELHSDPESIWPEFTAWMLTR